jgi:5'-nucleotidase
VALSLPLDQAARESVESMLVAPVGAFTVSEVYNTNRYGEVMLAAGDDAATIPTDLYRPGTPQAQQRATDNQLNRILLDDGKTTNLSTAGLQPPYMSPDAPLRVGDSVEAFGPSVLSYDFDEWRLQPTTPVDASTPPSARTAFKSTNPRPAAPESVGGDIKVASFNVFNYFVHFGGNARGAANEAELARQEAKTVSAITTLDADVIALEEIENSARFSPDNPQQALIRLVGALNTADGAGTWDYVRTPTQLPPASQQDFITTAIIFKPAKVQPKGESRSINDESVWFNAREPIAQTFTSGAETFTVVANHLKSKSTSAAAVGDNADTGDGQGAFNGDRVREAGSLVGFVNQVKADSGSADVLLLGDFNSYTQEDPMQVLYNAQYVDLNHTGKVSYVFNGESGSLDHAVASPSLASRVTGVDVWEINAHESYAFQYNGTPGFFAPNPYRSSDHNPIIIGLDTSQACTTTVTGSRSGPLTITSGLTCLENATISGPVTVKAGASLRATGGSITGPVTATSPGSFTISGTTINGSVTVTGATGAVLISQARINSPVQVSDSTGGVRLDTITASAPVRVTGNTGSQPVVVAANSLTGPLACSGNTPAPVNENRPNTVGGPASGQCARL